MRLKHLLASLACVVGTLAWAQHVPGGMDMDDAPAEKAATNGGRLVWSKAPEYLPEVAPSGFMDPRNPQHDPFDVRVTRVGDYGQPNPGERSAREQRSIDGRVKANLGPQPDEPAQRSSSSAIQPLTDTEVQGTFCSACLSPPDGCAAVSWSGHVVSSNNTHVEFHSEDGTQLYSETTGTFWAANSNNYQSTSLFQYEMLDGFTGGTISGVYWTDVNESDGDNAFTVKPLQYPFSTYGPGIYAVGAGGDNTSINYFDVTANLGDGPLLQSFVVDVPDWSGATNASQSGSAAMLDTGGDRVRTGFYGGNGKLHLAQTVNRNGTGFAEIRYTIVDVNTGTATTTDFGLDNWDYAYPWIVPWGTSAGAWDGGAMVGFLRSSSSTFPEFRVVHLDGAGNWGGSVQLRAGDSPIGLSNTSRWGDYIGGAWREGQSTPEVWMYGHFGQSNGYGIWLAQVVEDIEGCTDPFACNYDATAICDNGSCCYQNCLTIEMTDSFGDGWNGNIWEVVDPADGSVVTSGTLESGSIGTSVACLEAGCYDFRINTDDGLYVTEVGWTISGVDTGAASGDYAATTTFTIGGGGDDYACTDPAACNYSALAICDDGSCCYTNCATLVKNDSFGDGWNGGSLDLLDAEGNILNTFEMLTGSQEVESLCLEDGCYSLVFNAGSFPTEVSWTLTMDATGNMVGGGATYNEQFSINGVDGCTDPAACNYDATATCDDGTCDFGLWYLPNNVGDGPVTQACEAPEGYYLAVQSCIETVIAADPFCVNTNWDNICMRAYNCCLGINGCGDASACNYDVEACWDNTLCTYGGCNDPFACNFDPLAGCDDGSCTYDCYGCTYADAENYDPTATVDDDSCTFAPCSTDCPADLNGDGQIGTPDLLDLLGAFGVTCP